MKSPLVSIIIPVYNTAESLRSLVSSLENQTYTNLEIVAVDDGSKDDSLSVLKILAKEHANLKVFTKSNGGASSARNFGLKKSTGKYVCFVDSDDTLAPDFIKELVYAIEPDDNIKTAVVGCRLRRLKENTEFDEFVKAPTIPDKKDSPASYILRLLLANDGRFYAVTNKIFRAEIIKNHALEFDETMNFAEDTKFLLEYLKYAYGDINTIKIPKIVEKQPEKTGNYSYYDIIFIPKALYIYNFGTETSTVKKSALEWENWQASYNHLSSWIGKQKTKREQKLLKAIRLRWKISHAFSVARSDLKTSEKLKLINPFMLVMSSIAIKFRK